MFNIKRFSIMLLLFLLLLSFVHDLKKENYLYEEEQFEVNQDSEIAHIKIKPGDTVLSITEEINNLESLDINKIIADFKKLNPGADPETLKPNSFYYFPLYD